MWPKTSGQHDSKAIPLVPMLNEQLIKTGTGESTQQLDNLCGRHQHRRAELVDDN